MNSNESPRSTTPATTPARMTTFPRAIVERVAGFSYPPKVGTHRRPRSSPGSSSSAVASTPLPAMTPLQPRVAPSLEAPAKFITHTFLGAPEGIRSSPTGVPIVTHWPPHVESVVVSLPETKRWAGVNYLLPFPPHSVEWHVAEVFGRPPAYQNMQSPYPHVTGTFLKRTRKRKGVGTQRAYQLEMYTQEENALYGKLSANTNVVYLPAGWVPPSPSPSAASPSQSFNFLEGNES